MVLEPGILDGEVVKNPAKTLKAVRFGEFTFDNEFGELKKRGKRVHLRPLALHLLTMLLENPGSTVAREKLRDALWQRKVVEWETGLHRIAREIRNALGDDARQPRFVETVARRGYRFCAIVESTEPHCSVQPGVNRIRWFMAGVFTLPGVVFAYCVAAGIAG